MRLLIFHFLLVAFRFCGFSQFMRIKCCTGRCKFIIFSAIAIFPSLFLFFPFFFSFKLSIMQNIFIGFLSLAIAFYPFHSEWTTKIMSKCMRLFNYISGVEAIGAGQICTNLMYFYLRHQRIFARPFFPPLSLFISEYCAFFRYSRYLLFSPKLPSIFTWM